MVGLDAFSDRLDNLDAPNYLLLQATDEKGHARRTLSLGQYGYFIILLTQ